MLRRRRLDIESLLHDGAWFVGLTRALVVRDECDVDSMPVVARSQRIEPAPCLSEAVELAELRLELLDGVLALAEPWRCAVILRYLEGHRLARISEITCAPEFVVRRRLRRGVARIRAMLRARTD
jgi:DNA-directed RNA polymerase specialized sigma24 family protein